MRRLQFLICFLSLVTFSANARLRAQLTPAACGTPPAILKSTEPNIFSEQQEQWLGQAMADHVERDYRPVKNTELNAYLDVIGKRLLAVLPPTTIQFHYTLVESSEVNGFSLAGGRVYLTRKLVASARSEDEIAGVIAHEMGHILSHQFAIETTADFRKLLNITSVSDKADIYAKYQRLVDAREHQKHQTDPDTDDKQDQADRVGVYAAAAAGYRAAADAEFMDRSFFVGGKTGSRLSDFFRVTTPTQKRIRRIRGIIAELPQGCGAAVEAAASPVFHQWQQQVLENQAAVPQVAATVVAPTDSIVVQLSPPLRVDIDRLRFSRNGKYILAQDESSIFVLSREPFKVLFRIDAERALPAEFSPNSEQISFTTRGLHVEQWGIIQQKLIAAHEVVTKQSCFETILSPDGRTIACVVEPDSNGIGFVLLDVESGRVLFEKKTWFVPNYSFQVSLLLRQYKNESYDIITKSFSADGNMLLIGPGSNRMAFDLRTRQPIKLEGALKSYDYPTSYCFEGNDQIVAVAASSPDNSGIFSFPDGRRLKKLKLALPYMESTTGGEYVLTSGPPENTQTVVAVADVNSGRYVFGARLAALDVLGDATVNENLDGSLELLKIASKDPKDGQNVTLPLAPLAPARAAALSADGRYLAYSAHTRAIVWDTDSGKKMMMTRGFRHPGWTPQGTLLAEFPLLDKDHPRAMVELVPASQATRKTTYKLPDDAHLESGHMLEWKSENKKGWVFTAYSPTDLSVQWTRHFADGRPSYTTNLGDADLIFSYFVQSPLVKDKIHADATLRGQANLVREKAAGRLIEIVNSADGTTRASVVIEVPLSYEGVDGFLRVGDLLYLTVGDNRTIVYSLKTGNQVRQMFGGVVAVDAVSGSICVTNRRDETIVFDKNGDEVKHISLGSPLRYAALLDKGAELLVLTADQRIHRYPIKAGH